MLSSVSKAMYRAGMASLAVAGLCLFLGGPALAQFSGAKRAPDITAVEQVRAGRQGERVTLKGSLTKEVRFAQYMFKDKTGEVRVRIQRELWHGRAITSKMLLRLKGKIQSDVRGRFVNVDSVQVLN